MTQGSRPRHKRSDIGVLYASELCQLAHYARDDHFKIIPGSNWLGIDWPTIFYWVKRWPWVSAVTGALALLVLPMAYLYSFTPGRDSYVAARPQLSQEQAIPIFAGPSGTPWLNAPAPRLPGFDIDPVAGTAYPWANVGFPNRSPDPWGMYKRQCVSYAAWKVYASGRYMPYWGGRGNAYQWDDNARVAGIPVDRTPRAGDVAVRNGGGYGHVMYVETVHEDGSITVSQYNRHFNGRYSIERLSTRGLVFIHF